MQMHQSYGKQTFSAESCFLCGEEATSNQTAEHVFPKWLQNKYNLWNQKVELLNGSFIPYRQLTIPCCEQCNNQHLSHVENEIKKSVNGGYEKAIRVPHKLWYLWAGKIFYGILRKELSLLIDRSNPEGGTITSKRALESFSNLHLFLQGFRGRHEFTGDVPYSVLICNLHEFGDSFFFRDNLLPFATLIRLGEIGIIISFEDGGLIRDTYGQYVKEVQGRKLHPIQFFELYAKVIYQAGLMQHPVTYNTTSHVDGSFVATTEMASSLTRVEEWNREDFYKLLLITVSPLLNSNQQVKFVPPNKVSTWMVDCDGEPLLLSRGEWEKWEGH